MPTRLCAAKHVLAREPARPRRLFRWAPGAVVLLVAFLLTVLQAASAQGQVTSVSSRSISVATGNRTARIGGYCEVRSMRSGVSFGHFTGGTVSSATRGSAECVGDLSRTLPPFPNQAVSIELARVVLPQGSLFLETSPANATILIGGRNYLSGRSIPLVAGTHNVRVSASGYDTQSFNVQITANRPVRRSVTLNRRVPGPERVCPDGRTPPCLVIPPPRRSGVTFTSDEDSVLVKVDGIRRGSTGLNGRPLELDLSDGAYYLVFEKAGFYVREDSIVVRSDSAITKNIVLEPQVGLLEVFTYPDDALLYIEEDSVRTPFSGQLQLNRGGTRVYAYRIEKPGYATITGSENVDAVNRSVIETQMVALAGWIRARSEPAGAAVQIDNVEVGPTPLDLRVEPGRYRVTIVGGANEQVSVLQGGDVRLGEGPDPTDVLAQWQPEIDESKTPGVQTNQQSPLPSPQPTPQPIPDPGEATSVESLMERARIEVEHGRYNAAFDIYSQVQNADRTNQTVFDELRKLERARARIATLTDREREDREILHVSLYQEAISLNCEDFRSVALSLSRLVPDDPATFYLRPRACETLISPGSRPIDLVYVYGASEYPEAEEIVRDVEAPPFAGFQLSATEITNAQFEDFLRAAGELRTEDGKRFLAAAPVGFTEERRGQWVTVPGMENMPVVDATWYGAKAYTAWAGGRLPTVAEWRWAFALGAGNAEEPLRCNCAGSLGEGQTEAGVFRVGQFGADGLGLFDMAGNTWEWAGDEPRDRRSRNRTILGGSFRTSPEGALTPAAGSVVADVQSAEIGFRLLIPIQ